MNKKLLLVVALLAGSLPVMAKNKISMVTFFPVPYVAYSRVNVTQQMDIGLAPRDCQLSLGCSALANTQKTLNVTTLNLKSGQLALMGATSKVEGTSIAVGENTGVAALEFANLRANSIVEAFSINTPSLVADSLNLFGQPFPSCKAANSLSAGVMSWQKLALGPDPDLLETYLVCGN